MLNMLEDDSFIQIKSLHERKTYRDKYYLCKTNSLVLNIRFNAVRK
jgi:hypothetical protein